jgi:putative DNA primase/helicase
VAYQAGAFLVRDLGVPDDTALGLLQEWDGGNRPPKGAERLREILANVHTYGHNGYGSGLNGDGHAPRPAAAGQTAPVSTQDKDGQQQDGGDGGKPDIHLTDLGNARRVLQRHGQDLHYCHPWKSWLTWDGRRWAVDERAGAAGRMKETQGHLYRETAERIKELSQVEEKNEEQEKELSRLVGFLKHLLKWEEDARLGACLNQMKSEPGIPAVPAQLDTDPYLLNVLNGTIDLKTGRLREHRREDLLTKLAPVTYDPAARCPLWDRCMLRWKDGNLDLVEYDRRVVGYCLTGDVREQCLWFLYGLGANGKSTYLQLLLHLLGDYAIQAVSELLMQKRNESHPTERADLFGRRFVATIETDDGRKIAESLMKQLTGGDRVRARKMRQDFFEFDQSWKIFLAANHKPVVTGNDHATWRRIKLVPWTVTIPDSEKDKNLLAKLKAEASGVLNWALGGCRAWQERGLGEPEEVRAATDAYRAEQDLLAGFIAECCFVKKGNPDVRVQSSALLLAYHRWAGDKEMTSPKLTKQMEAKGYHKKAVNGCMYWMGIGLTADAEQQDRLGL